MKKISYIIMIILFTLMLVACDKNKDNEKPTMNIDYITLNDGTETTKRSGQSQEFFNVTEEKSQEVKVTINKISGDINIKIFNTNDTSIVIYEGHDFETNTFTVNVKDAGRYTIFVTCDKYVGDYSFKYDLTIQ